MSTAKEFYEDPTAWGNVNWDRVEPTTFTKSEMFDFAERYHQSKISKSESPQCVSDSRDASDDLHTGYQMEGGADSNTNASEAVTVPLPKRSEDGNICSTCKGTKKVPDFSGGWWPCVDCHTEEKI